MGDKDGRRDVGIEALVAGAAGLAVLAHPVGLAIAATAAAPLVAKSGKDLVRRMSERRQERQENLVRGAAAVAGADPEEIAARCAAQPELEELLNTVLTAAGDTTTREKLVVYALMLGEAVKEPDLEYRWETAFVGVVRDLEPIHIELLDRFTRTSNELGLGNGGKDFDEPPAFLNDVQVALIADDFLAALPLALATLQGHGLLVHEFAAGGAVGSGSTYGFWTLTDFGREVNRLLKAIGEGLTGADLRQ